MRAVPLLVTALLMLTFACPASAQDQARRSKKPAKAKPHNEKKVAKKKRPLPKKSKAENGVIVLSTLCGGPVRRSPLTAAVELARERFDHWTKPFRGSLGVKTRPLRKSRRKDLGAPPDAGVRVARVTRGSVAAIAGVKTSDVLIDVGGTTIRTGKDVRAAMRRANVGELLTLQVIRRGKPMTLATTLSARSGKKRPAGVIRFASDVPPAPRVGPKLERIKKRLRRLRVRRYRVYSR